LDVRGFEDEAVKVMFGVEGDVGCYAAELVFTTTIS
jgi:hypothetical protein